MPKRLDIPIGSKYNRLTFIEEMPPEIQHNKEKITPLRKAKCLCDCGNTVTVRLVELVKGRVKSCGCQRIDSAKKGDSGRKHGKCGTRLYITYMGMLARCYDEDNGRYPYYGGRGIIMCDEWKNDFISFYNWAVNNGYTDDLTIDRINNDGIYEPSNCRWATHKEQMNNNRRNVLIDFNGETKTLMQVCEILGISYKKTHHRIRKFKWDINRALYE